jgi:Protein  of unknown function (DUF3018)
MSRFPHGTDPKKGEAPHTAAAHGFAVPDLRDPKDISKIRHEIKIMARHPDNDAINDWIESGYDWESWK